MLASNVGGVPETLSPDETGLLLPPGDAGVWRRAILKMCDASFRQPMGAAARRYVQEHFSTTVIADEFVRILADR